MAISMALIPLMARFASRLGLIDQPNDRKVHVVPIPRVGGVGIVIGALIAIYFLLPFDALTQGYLLGAIVLFVFGLWDDISEIGHYPKFLGQLIAALCVVLYGELYVVSVPFVPGGEIPATLGIPFSVVALIGMINAINHSDGLDGLAGGESMFSIGAIALLSFLAGDVMALTIALSVMGGILGFLRYNTHPARVFMGDSGSQFLGYTVGFLAILLTQRTELELSPAVVLLLLGLPIIDILVVASKRVRSKLNLFEATRNHIHHRLLDLGFVHQESVIIIYSMQMVFVTSGVLLRYESNELITIVYVALCAGIFLALNLAERSGWHLSGRHRGADQDKVMAHDILRKTLVIIPRRFLSIGIPVYLVGTALTIEHVPSDFAKLALLISGLMVLELFFGSGPHSVMRRALIYVTAAFVVYLGISYRFEWAIFIEPVNTTFYALTAIAFAAAVKFSPRRRKAEFSTTATDYLVVLCLMAVLVASKGDLWGNLGITFVVQMVVLFYGCELLITEKRTRWGGLSAAALVASLILAVRGILLA